MAEILCFACGCNITAKATARRKLVGDTAASKRVFDVWKSLCGKYVDAEELEKLATRKVCWYIILKCHYKPYMLEMLCCL